MSANSTPIPDLLTTAEAAELMKVSKTTMRRLQTDGHISFVKIRGCVRFAKADIASFLEKNRVKAVDEIQYGSTKR